MPWPMIHFAVSIELYRGQPSPSFLLGSIAPDAVLVKKDNRAAKMKSHLVTPGKLPDADDLISFYKSHVTDDTTEEERLYLLGYISHIFTDGRWDDCKRDIMNNLPNSLQSPRELLQHEENQLDCNLFHKSAWTGQVRHNVLSSPVFELELYETQDLLLWREQVFAFLDNPASEPGIELEYLTEEMSAAFIRQVSDELTCLFGNAELD